MSQFKTWIAFLRIKSWETCFLKLHLVICNDEWDFSELVMSHAFGNAYWDWYLPLVSSGWAILTVALPPVSVTNNLPFVTGCIQSMTSILADLIKPERSKVVLVSTGPASQISYSQHRMEERYFDISCLTSSETVPLLMSDKWRSTVSLLVH